MMKNNVSEKKNMKKSEKSVKPAAISWIHGNRGTNDVVLVFRTNILMPTARELRSNAAALSLTLKSPPTSKQPPSEHHIGKETKDWAIPNRKYDSNSDVVPAPNMPAFRMGLTYKLQQSEAKLLRFILNRHGLTEAKNDTNFSILWTGVALDLDILRNIKPYQRVNHFPRSLELTRKDNLYKNIVAMQRLHGVKHFDIVPQSFIFPKECRELIVAHIKYRGPWIVKPMASSRGRGIYIVSNPEQIAQDEDVIVSKYVTNPFCIKGHKCDLRLYVLVTSFDPLLIYIYEEGLVRLATVKYELKPDNLWNPCIHLCNYSINKFHSDYVPSNDEEDEDVGHKWTLSAFLRHLKTKNCNTIQLMLNIEDLIIKALLSCAQLIITGCHMFMPSGNNCFELYGFDILIDANFKPWLIEVNLAPSMAIESRLDSRVKACLITDVLTCVGIPALSPETRARLDKNWTRYKYLSGKKGSSSTGQGRSTYDAGSRRLTRGQTGTSVTAEESRIITNARQQNARRGGFVRIFPTDDTMRRYCNFLDQKTPLVASTYPMSHPNTRNYNQLLFDYLYGKCSCDNGGKEGNSLGQRMLQYERSLPSEISVLFNKKSVEPRNVEKAKRLRCQIMNRISSRLDLTISQSRQVFSAYLYAVARRIYKEPCPLHEKWLLKFLKNAGRVLNTAAVFRNPYLRHISKSQTAIVLRQLGEFLELYDRETEVYSYEFNHTSMIPTGLFSEFMCQAYENDFEAVLSLQTKVTGEMSYLYVRSESFVPPTPTIPCEEHGFLKALPAMVRSNSGTQ